MNDARNHHYLSQCYLRGFSKNGGKKSKLTAFSLREGKVFETSTRNVGGVRDFNRIEAEGVEPNILESSLAEFEGSVATELKNLSQGLPFTGNTKEIILSFISLLAVRTPAMREHMESQITPIIDMIARLTVSSQERYEHTVKDYEEKTGTALADQVSYEQMRKFVQEGNYKISLKREFLIAAEIQISKAVDETLHQRSWRLFRSTSTSGDYITSDNPVTLMWESERNESPGFLVPGTVVIFPVSKSLILVGDFNGVEGVFDAEDNFVAIFNANTIFRSVERIFSSDKNFFYIDKNGNREQGKKLV